jgi:hypothetical protein
MYGYTLQDWITIRGATSVSSITQGEQGWMGFAPYQDIVFWLDVREITLGGATSINMNFETAPTKDDILFMPMLTSFAMAVTNPTPTVKPVLLSSSTPLIPLARWARWRLSVVGTATSSWDVTFRILCAANAVSVVNG